jgi:hypothetical protein
MSSRPASSPHQRLLVSCDREIQVQEHLPYELRSVLDHAQQHQLVERARVTHSVLGFTDINTPTDCTMISGPTAQRLVTGSGGVLFPTAVVTLTFNASSCSPSR